MNEDLNQTLGIGLVYRGGTGGGITKNGIEIWGQGWGRRAGGSTETESEGMLRAYHERPKIESKSSGGAGGCQDLD